MIYTSSLAMSVRQALGQSAYQTKINELAQKLVLDPSISGMQAVILGPKDFNGLNGNTLMLALKKKHPAICIIYLYSKPVEEKLCDTPYKKLVKKINKDAILEVCDLFLQEHEISKKELSINEKQEIPDLVVPEIDTKENNMEAEKEATVEESDTDKVTSEISSSPSSDTVQMEDSSASVSITPIATPSIPEPIAKVESKSILDVAKEVVKNVQVDDSESTLEENLRNIRGFNDWTLLKEQLNKDAVMARLIHENTEYAGIQQVLEVLDMDMQNIFRDTSLSAEMKFNKLAAVGRDRSTLKAAGNTILANKIIEIMNTLVDTAQAVTDAKVAAVNKAMEHIMINKHGLLDEKEINDAMDARIKAQIGLQSNIRDIIDLYHTLATTVTTAVKELDEKLPSSNAYINEVMSPAKNLFTPLNTAELANTLMDSLQNKLVTLSALEDKVTAVINSVFKLLDTDTEVIEHQARMINLLKTNRIENVVVLDSLVKNVINIYAGAIDTGVTATTLINSFNISRSRNVLVIDCSKHHKLESYGVAPITWQAFIEERPERQLCCVTLDAVGDDYDVAVSDITSVVEEMLYTYSVVNVIFDSSMHECINQISHAALTLNFITNCTQSSLQSIKYLHSDCAHENIAHRLILIDSPISALEIAKSVEFDPTVTRLITIPYLSNIRKCALKHTSPTEYSEVTLPFKEAFR